MRELAADLVRIGSLSRVRSFQMFGYLCGGLLVLSGLVHVGVYLVDGGPWGRSAVVAQADRVRLVQAMLATVTWLMAFLQPRRLVGWLVIGVFAIASVGEVFLISMQTWRGVASHFTRDHGLRRHGVLADGAAGVVRGAGGVAVTLWAFGWLDAPPSLALAIRLGLVLMLVSQAVGVQMIVEGGNTFGAARALKVPHAVTLHAVQVLPALAILLLAAPELLERRRVAIVSVAAVGYASLIASTMVQTYGGLSPFELGPLSSGLALLGLGLLAVSACLRGARRRGPRTPSRPGPAPGPVNTGGSDRG